MKKRVAPSMTPLGGKPSHSAPLESTILGAFLNILKHCAITRFEDGTPRLGGTIIIRCEGTAWKMILKEPSAQLCLPLMAQTFDDLLATAELYLGAEEAPWEDDPNAWVPKPRGKKKD